MNFTYETRRLRIRILNGTYAAQALRFYKEDRELFERYEPLRVPNFYTENFQRYMLNYEYSQIVKGTMIRYWVFPKRESRRIIGTVSLRNIMHGSYHKCEIGYKFSSAYQGQHYASEAIRRIIWIAFTELNIHRLEACCMPENDPSIRLLEALGFGLEGRMRQYTEIQGRYRDHLLFSLLRP